MLELFHQYHLVACAVFLLVGLWVGRSLGISTGHSRGVRSVLPPSVTLFVKRDSRGRWRGSLIGSDRKASLITCRNYRSRAQLREDLTGDLAGISLDIRDGSSGDGEAR